MKLKLIYRIIVSPLTFTEWMHKKLIEIRENPLHYDYKKFMNDYEVCEQKFKKMTSIYEMVDGELIEKEKKTTLVIKKEEDNGK